MLLYVLSAVSMLVAVLRALLRVRGSVKNSAMSVNKCIPSCRCLGVLPVREPCRARLCFVLWCRSTNIDWDNLGFGISNVGPVRSDVQQTLQLPALLLFVLAVTQ